MKKLAITATAALALLASPLAGSASAAQQEPVQSDVKVYYFQGDIDQMNDWCKQIVSKYYPSWDKGEKVYKYNHVPKTEKQAPKPKAQQPTKQKEQQPAKQNVQQPAKEQATPAKPAPAPAQPEQQKPAEQKSDQLSAYEQKVVELTNAERAKNGLAPLKIDNELSKVAREKSKDMSVNKYFDHNSPTYGSPFDMMKKFGISYRSAGENIAMGQRTPEEVVKAWMDSTGHRENILSSNYTHIGVGYVENGNYWTQQFIGK